MQQYAANPQNATAIQESIIAPWRRNAEALADWTSNRLVNRTDVYGGYLPERYRQKTDADGKTTTTKTVTKPAKAKRGKVKLGRATIVRHFIGEDVGHIIGLHTTSPENTCRWFAVEIDAHEPDDTDAPGRNFRAVIHWKTKLDAAGFTTVMLDSNGAGGIHLLVILDTPAPAADVYAYVQSIIADYADHGFTTAPETFPKQPQIEPGKYGNWLRLPGRHHTRPHWSKLWDGEQWLEGENAIAAILAHIPSSAALVPAAPTPHPAPTNAETSNTTSTSTVEKPKHRSDPAREKAIAKRCIEAIPNTVTTSYDDWVRVGMALHDVYEGDGPGLELFIKWSSKSTKHIESECGRVWKDFSSNRTKKATIGTLIKLARDAGADPFPPLGTDDHEAIENARQAVYAAISNAYDADEEDSPSPAIAFDAAPHLARLPAGERAESLGQFKDAIGQTLNLNEVRREIKKEEKKLRKLTRKGMPNGLPEIVISGRPLRDISDDARAALVRANKPPVMFRFAGEIARIIEDEHGNHRPQICNEAMVRGRATRVADFVVATEDGMVNVSPPIDCVRDLMTRTDCAFPILNAVVESPILRPDGSIVIEPGYDDATHVCYVPRADRPRVLPKIDPNADDLRDAVELTQDIVADFPLDGPASKANLLAFALTPILRHAIDDVAPIAAVDATSPGTGKSLIVDVISIMATGELPTLISAPGSDEEWVKVMGAVLSTAPGIVKIDNIDGVLRSPTLAAVVSANHYTARELGRSKMNTVAVRAAFALTGNNIQLGGDLPRRVYPIRMDSHSSRAWLGRAFRHPNLLEHVRKHRHELTAALLTIARSWYAAGMPPAPADTPVIGGYEKWSRTMGGVLHHAGIPGFLTNILSMYESNDEVANEWAAFLAAWRDRFGSVPPMTVSQIVAPMVKGEAERMKDSLPSVLAVHANDPVKLTSKLGYALRRYRGRRFDGLFIERGEGDLHSKVATWSIEQDHVAGDEGDAGDVSSAGSQTPYTSSDDARTHAHTQRYAPPYENGPKDAPPSPHPPQTENSTGRVFVVPFNSLNARENLAAALREALKPQIDEYEQAEREAIQQEATL